jgi:uncharacterized damage-inducible protein DinB
MVPKFHPEVCTLVTENMATDRTSSQPEVWLRGPLPGFDPWVMPVAHALLQAREDVLRLAATVPAERVWERPGGAASVGFHILHIAGSLDRLLTYARGETLNDQQRAALKAEAAAEGSGLSLQRLTDHTAAAIDRALNQVRATSPKSLLDARSVGRAALPSTVLGLLVHAAEHTTRHVGQAITTAKLLEP